MANAAAWRPLALASALLALALLHQHASAARVLHQDFATDSSDVVEPEPRETDTGITYGVVQASSTCDLSVEGAWSTKECSLDDDSSSYPTSIPLADGASWTIATAAVNYTNLPVSLMALTFESAVIDVEFDDSDASDKKLYAAILAGKNMDAMTSCVFDAALGDECKVPSNDVFFAWGLTDKEPLSLLGELITLGEDETGYRGMYSHKKDELVVMADMKQIDAARESDKGTLYVALYLMTNQDVTIKQLGLNGVATAELTLSPTAP